MIMVSKDIFSVTKTPQQNGVVERKNRTVMEMARTMLNESKLSNILWPQAVHTDVHILNRIFWEIIVTRHLTSYGKVDQQVWNTLEFLVVNVT